MDPTPPPPSPHPLSKDLKKIYKSTCNCNFGCSNVLHNTPRHPPINQWSYFVNWNEQINRKYKIYSVSFITVEYFLLYYFHMSQWSMFLEKHTVYISNLWCKLIWLTVTMNPIYNQKQDRNIKMPYILKFCNTFQLVQWLTARAPWSSYKVI